MDRSKWIWMPHAAHLVVGNDYRFHLATYVGGYLVSTVGEWWPDQTVRKIHAKVHDPQWLDANQGRKGDDFDRAYFKRFGYEEIGADRTYETMVFKAAEAPVDEVEQCCPWRIVVSECFDSDGYNDPGEARRRHDELCEQWAKIAHEEAVK